MAFMRSGVRSPSSPPTSSDHIHSLEFCDNFASVQIVQIVHFVHFDTFCAECVVLCGLIHSVRFVLQTGAPFRYDDNTVEPAVGL